MKIQRRIACCLLGLLVLVLLAACRTDAPPVDEAAAAPAGIRTSVERGPVTVTLATDRAELTVAQRLTLTIRVDADEPIAVELPRFGDKLEQFGIVDDHTRAPRLIDDDRTRTERTYVLEPFLSGEYTIPPMEIAFWRESDPAPERRTVATEPITVTVTSLLGEAARETNLHDIRPPVELPDAGRPWLWFGVGATAAVLLACGLLVRRRRRSAASADVPPEPAHVRALRELAALVADDLVAKDAVKPFYQRISDILRRYVENRYGLRAPEQTTEEFLAELDARSPFDDAHNRLLRDFLSHCDLVKFAAHRPGTSEIRRTFDRCRTFITATAEPEVPPRVGSGG